jgi:hypothetical protein
VGHLTTDNKKIVRNGEIIFHVKINRLQGGDKVYSVEMTAPWPTVNTEAMNYLLRLERILDQKVPRSEKKITTETVTQEFRDKVKEVLADGEKHPSKELKAVTGLDRNSFLSPMKVLVAEGWVGYQMGGKGKSSFYWSTEKK